MDLGDLARAADTHLDDLQANVEAGSRQLDRIGETSAKLQETIPKDDSRQARLVAALMNRVRELKSCVMQQRETLRELRRDIRRIRQMTEQT